MLTRREMLVLTGAGTAWAAAALSGRGARAAIAAQTPVNFDVPSGACDCHAHIFPDPARYPFTPNRVYTPSGATVEDLLELQRALHLDRVILNQPSVYGTDNTALLDGIRQLGPQRARGVVIVDEKTTDAQLGDMDATVGLLAATMPLGTAMGACALCAYGVALAATFGRPHAPAPSRPGNDGPRCRWRASRVRGRG